MEKKFRVSILPGLESGCDKRTNGRMDSRITIADSVIRAVVRKTCCLRPYVILRMLFSEEGSLESVDKLPIQ